VRSWTCTENLPTTGRFAGGALAVWDPGTRSRTFSLGQPGLLSRAKPESYTNVVNMKEHSVLSAVIALRTPTRKRWLQEFLGVKRLKNFISSGQQHLS
jgi:hypothetical protein